MRQAGGKNTELATLSKKDVTMLSQAENEERKVALHQRQQEEIKDMVTRVDSEIVAFDERTRKMEEELPPDEDGGGFSDDNDISDAALLRR